MASRLKLHEELCEILGTRNVYYNSPEPKKMVYPCIRYSPSEPKQRYANNKTYSKVNCYDGVVIDYDAESEIANQISDHFQMCKLGKPYPADNLHHFPFTLHY